MWIDFECFFGLKCFLLLIYADVTFCCSSVIRITEDTWQSVSSKRLRREFQERGKGLCESPA